MAGLPGMKMRISLLSRGFWIVVVLLAVCAGVRGALADESTLCKAETAAAETAQQLPTHLLSALSVAESGRKDPATKARTAWPWTIHAEGRGQYFSEKDAAIREVRRLKANGVRNIDVGCMQVNLAHHPKAFTSLEEAFDPALNAAYAAKFLKDLHSRTRSWTQAVAFYHSTTSALNLPYRHKVMAIWGEEIRRASDTRRQAVLEKWRQRRQDFAEAQGGVAISAKLAD